MARFDKTIKPSAAIPRRKSSLGRREKSNSSIHETILLHPTRHLIVTTTKGVFTWGNQGVKEIFTSGSGGIVAARRVKNGSSLLAVADSQVVILHDTRKGMQKSYKLRGSDVSQQLNRNWEKIADEFRAKFVYFDMLGIPKAFSSPPLFRTLCKLTL